MGHFAFEEKENAAMKAYFIQLMLEQNILASNLFYAMYAHQSEHVRQYLDAADTAFAEIAEAKRTGDLADRLKGHPSVSGFERLN